MQIFREKGLWKTKLEDSDYEKFSELINKFKDMDKAKLVPKGHFKELSDDEIWIKLVCQFCVAGGTRKWDKLKSDEARFNGFKRKLSLSLIVPDITYVSGVLTNATRFYNRAAKFVIDNLTNSDVVQNNRVVALEDLDSSMDFNTIRKTLMERICHFGLKSASDFMISMGLSDNVAAFDTRVIGFLQKHFNFNVDISRIRSDRDRYLSVENSLRKVSEKFGIPLAKLERIIFNYGSLF